FTLSAPVNRQAGGAGNTRQTNGAEGVQAPLGVDRGGRAAGDAVDREVIHAPRAVYVQDGEVVVGDLSARSLHEVQAIDRDRGAPGGDLHGQGVAPRRAVQR